MGRTAVIFPTWNRVQQAAACIRRLLDTADVDVWVVSEDNPSLFGLELLDHPHFFFFETTRGMTAVQKWNYGLSVADADNKYASYMLGADDIWPADGWYEPVVEQLSYGAGLVSFNDGVTDGNLLGTHYIMSRDFIVKHHGGVMAVPHYRSWGLDVEATARAKRAGLYHWAKDSHVEHRHVHWNKAKMDDTYKAGYRVHQYDEFILTIRRNAGFPNDFQAVIV